MTFLHEPCGHRETVVGAHLPSFGRGVSTKVSDLAVAALCGRCHDLLDGRDKRGVNLWEEPEFWLAVMRANHETLTRAIMAGHMLHPGQVFGGMGVDWRE